MHALLCWTGLLCVLFAAQTEARRARPRDEGPDPDSFLEKFGYLSEQPPDVQHSQEARAEGIRNYQRMMGLEVTGRLNEQTMTHMTKPRCGLPDVVPAGGDIQQNPGGGGQSNRMIAESYYAPGYKWGKTQLTWRSTNYSPDMTEGAQRRALYQAFEHWSSVTPLGFSEIGSGDADIMIKFAHGEHGDGPGNAFDGLSGVLAHAFYPEDGATHFDEAEQWTEYTQEGTNLAIVAAHEFGHALGLGHSNVPQALMAPVYQGYDANFQLDTDDIQAIQSLYGAAAPPPRPDPTQPPPRVTTTRAPAVPTSENPNQKPNTCSSKFDAILQAHDTNLYIFRGKWIWRVNDYSGVVQGFPKLIRKVYNSPPKNIGGAVYSWRTRYTYFFKANKIFKYYGFQRIERKTVTTRGYPSVVNSAFMAHDGEIYLLSGRNYFVFDEYQMDLKSVTPQRISAKWPGVPDNIEATVRLRDGFVYFFKGLKYRKFDEYYERVLPGYPRVSHSYWMGPECGGNFDPK